MTNNGILRSKPRYSSSADNNDDAPTSNNTPTTSSSDNNGVGVRSLADLVRSSAELSAEAADITHADVGTVVSHHGVSSSAPPDDVADNNTNNGTTLLLHNSNVQDQEEKIIMEGIPLLQISESGSPYLTAAAAADAHVSSNNNGPAVVDANGDIAFGIVGDDGEHVKFCEHIEEDCKENDENISSRERIQHRINVYDTGDEDMFFDEGGPTNECNISDSDSDATDDDAILAELGMSELVPSEHDDESDYEPEEQAISRQSNNSVEMRAFLIIWQTLSQWVTPTTVELLQGQETEPQPTVTEESPDNKTSERRSVEIGASRRSGIMSMIRMYIARSIGELKKMPHPTQQQKDTLNDKRKIEERLADLVRTFDVNGPVANFNTKQWKVMTTILIVISFPSSIETDSITTLPASAQSLGMTTDEYRYLTRSALTSLSKAL